MFGLNKSQSHLLRKKCQVPTYILIKFNKTIDEKIPNRI